MNKEKSLRKETVGASSLRLSKKAPDASNPFEQMLEQLSDYDKNIHKCVEDSKKDYEGDFYIVVLTKKERLMKNVLRSYFYARKSCPTPDYDQAVYRYKRVDDAIDFLWVVPAIDMVNYMAENKQSVPTEQYELLSYVLKFKDDSLLKLAKRLNGEREDSIFLDK